jgi:hypothetical protein
MHKIYLKEALLDADSQVKHRISLINGFDYKRYRSLVGTEIIEQNDHYSYRQDLLEIKKIKSLKRSDFIGLVRALEYFNLLNFVHGDLNKKNIIYTEDGFKIIDYEPSHVQIKNKIKQLMVTMPYVLRSDLEGNIATTATDKIGFFYFVLRVNNAFSSMNIVKLSKELNHDTVLGFDVNTINSITYLELLDRAYSIIQKQQH